MPMYPMAFGTGRELMVTAFTFIKFLLQNHFGELKLKTGS
jgi:hypothetical protein